MLTKKLHLKPGMRFTIMNLPDGFAPSMGQLPAGVTQVKALSHDLDLVLLFATDQKVLKRLWAKTVELLLQGKKNPSEK